MWHVSCGGLALAGGGGIGQLGGQMGQQTWESMKRGPFNGAPCIRAWLRVASIAGQWRSSTVQQWLA